MYGQPHIRAVYIMQSNDEIQTKSILIVTYFENKF